MIFKSTRTKIISNLATLIAFLSLTAHYLQSPRMSKSKSVNLAQIRESVEKSNTKKMDHHEFKRIMYGDYMSKMSSIIHNHMLVQESILEEKYPNLVPNECSDKEGCKTYMFEVVNQSLGVNWIKQMPTVLLIGGMNGSEITGIRTMIAFVELAQKLYTMHRDWYNMLNSVRVLVIPVLNMEGYSHLRNYEVRQGKRGKVNAFPSTDFNLETSTPCFETLSSQFLSMLHRDNLIYASLNFSGNDFQIDSPQVHKYLSKGNPHAPDQAIFQDVSQVLSVLYNAHKPEEAPSMSETFVPVERDDVLNGALYEDWAYGSSKFKMYTSKKCISENNTFKRVYTQPSEESHRSFALRIGINSVITESVHDHSKEEEHYANHEHDCIAFEDYALGNEVYLLSPQHESAQKGLIPVGLMMINKFIKLMVPTVRINEIGHKLSGEKQYLEFFMTVRGCLQIGETKSVMPELTEKKVHKSQEEKVDLKKVQVVLSATLENDEILDIDKEYDMQLSIECNQHLLDLVESPKQFVSHFARSQTIPNYRPVQKTFGLDVKSMRRVHLNDVILSRISDAFVYTQTPMNSSMFYHSKFLVQVGAFFPIEILYNKTNGNLQFQILENQIPEVQNDKDYSNLSGNVGMFSRLRDSRENRKLVKILNKLKAENIDKIKGMIYSKNIHSMKNGLSSLSLRFLTLWNRQEHKQTDFTKIHSKENNKFVENYLKDETETPRENETPEEIKKRHLSIMNTKIKHSVRAEYSIIQKYYNKDDYNKPIIDFESAPDLEIKEDYDQTKDIPLILKKINLFTEMSEGSENAILPACFVDLLGRSVTFQVWFEDKNNNYLSKSKRNIFALIVKKLKTHLVRFISGNIVIYDKSVIGSVETTKQEGLTSVSELKKLPPNEPAIESIDGVYCSSLYPFVSVAERNLTYKVIFEKMRKKTDNPYFYFISVKPLPADPSMSVVKFYTNNPLKSEKVSLFNKSSKLVLKQSSEFVQLSGDLSNFSKDISIYKGAFDTKDVVLVGKYVFVQTADESEVLFDCFYSKINIGISVNSFLEIQSILNNELHVIDHEWRQIEFEQRWYYPLYYVITNLYFWGFLVVVSAVAGYYWISLKMGSEIKKEAEELYDIET